MSFGPVNTKFYSFNLYFILFKERSLEKHRCIVLSIKLKMFRKEDKKEQDVSIIDSSIARHFFLNIEVANFLPYWAYWGLFRIYLLIPV